MEAQTSMEVDSVEDNSAELSAALNIKKEKRKFNAKLFGRTIQKGFAKMYKDADLSDLTLIVGDDRIPVHRMVACFHYLCLLLINLLGSMRLVRNIQGYA